MQLGMIGLGRMGGSMAQRLLQSGHDVVAYDRDRAAVETAAGHGATAADGPADLVARLTAPRRGGLIPPAGGLPERTPPMPDHMAATWKFLGFDEAAAGKPFAEPEGYD